jgi:hypothetical protein
VKLPDVPAISLGPAPRQSAESFGVHEIVVDPAALVAGMSGTPTTLDVTWGQLDCRVNVGTAEAPAPVFFSTHLCAVSVQVVGLENGDPTTLRLQPFLAVRDGTHPAAPVRFADPFLWRIEQLTPNGIRSIGAVATNDVRSPAVVAGLRISLASSPMTLPDSITLRAHSLLRGTTY